MNRSKMGYLRLGVLGAVLFGLLIFSGACATAEKTPTPVPSATTAPAAAPTAALPPTATPTRVLPTPTPVATGKPQYGGTLTVALRGSVNHFDPTYNALWGSRRPMFTIYNNIVRLNPDGTIGPELARSWELSPDGKIITFHLQPGVTFHDGTPLDAASVKWNYDRHLDPNSLSAQRVLLSPPLQRVEAPDSQTVKFYLSNPLRPFLLALTDQAGEIVSPEAVRKSNSYSNPVGDFSKRPVGSGAFKFAEWRLDERIQVVRNENYWEKGLPYVDRISFPIVPDLRVVFAMLRTGETDVMEEMNSADVPTAEANPNIKVVLQEGVRTRRWQFRTTAEPWNNKALRQAFAYAFDRKTIVDVLYAGRFAEVANSGVASAYRAWYDPTFKKYEYNPAMARQKLAEAGYPNGFTFELPCRNTTFELSYCETVQVMLANVGIKMTIRPWPQTTYVADFLAKKSDLADTATIVLIDPYRYLRTDYYSTATANLARTAWKTPPEIDRLILDSGTIYDLAKAKEASYQIIGMILEELPTIYVVSEHYIYGLRRTTQNFKVYPDAISRLAELWLTR